MEADRHHPCLPANAERPIIEVTFDGETCSVSGPTSVGGAYYWLGDIVGEGQAFVLTDTSGLRARVVITDLGRKQDGGRRTYDELVEASETVGAPFHLVGDNHFPDGSFPGSYIGEENTISFAPEHRPTIELADN